MVIATAESSDLGGADAGGGVSRRRFDALAVAGLAAFTVASRLVFLPPGMMGFDGPDYVGALRLDRSFSVPPPGNIGYVLLGKLCSQFVDDPVRAYEWAGVLLSCWGVAFVYVFATLVLPRWIAVGVAACVGSSAMVWYHGVILQSYIVWIATLPMIAYWSVRLARERRVELVIAASLATGLATILRPDMVVFGGPLLGAGLVIGRAKWWQWMASAAICAACCCVWLFGTASLVGGVGRYMDIVRAKQSYHEGLGYVGRGFFEGVLRNGVKYAQYMLWSVHVAIVPAAVGAGWYLKGIRRHWAAWVFAACWAGPSLVYAIGFFMGAAGFILPAVPLVYLAAGKGVQVMLARRESGGGMAVAVLAVFVVASINVVQFATTPLPRLTDQRRALLTHMFFGYSGAGLSRMYDFQPKDFGIETSLANTIRQFRRPEPLPDVPERLPMELRPDGR